MKRALAVAVLCLAASAFAQTAHRATGVVTRVDAERSKVTIKHGPVPSLKWPAMTMAFIVRDKAMLEKMPKDRKIEFEFVQQGREYVVTSVN